MAGILSIYFKNTTSEHYLSPGTVTTIGRTNDNSIVLEHDAVSRHHAKIEWADDNASIIDLGSSNGTSVNGEGIEAKVPFTLKDNDEISIADFKLEFHITDKKPVPTITPESQTVVLKAETQSVPIPSLTIQTVHETNEYPLEKEIITVGRDPENDIVIDDPSVSRKHAKLQHSDKGYEIIDLGSTNGLTFNNAQVTEKILQNGDVVSIAGAVTIYFTLAREATGAAPETEEKLEMKGREEITIGRGSDNDIVLAHPAASRHHAHIKKDSQGFMLEDLGSTNGTFLNGQRISEPTLIHRGDTIRIGAVKFIYSEDVLEKVDDSQDLGIAAIGVNKVVGHNINLLQNISLNIDAHEFVAIVGGSGAGKTTLLKALNAFNPATSGTVLINGENLYHNLDAHRSDFGYVPQEDIIHKELTVNEALDYSARLRLPADSTSNERKQRIEEVLDTLDITERRYLPIRKLSGGQMKRVSIGVELLTKPGIFCLDEATSGLDPGIESQVMRLLRKLSDQGQTILMVTHATKNVMICDKVVFLARGGHLAYFGPPEEALSYFGVEDFDRIYDKLETELTPQEWGEQYRQSDYHQKYIADKLPEKAEELPEEKRKSVSVGPQTRHISALRQFFILSRRNMNILARDRISLILMLLLAPLVGAFDFIFWEHGLFEIMGGDSSKAIMNLFMAAMIGAMVGSLSVMREIVKETDIYRRERMVILKIAPYIFSKLWVAIVIALYQAIIFLLFMKLAGGWPPVSSMAPVFITLTMVIFSGMLLGLLASAISPNPNVTPLLLIIVIVPQLLFGGIIPLGTMGQVGQTVSQGISTKWAFESLVTISELGIDVAEDPCWQLSEDERKALTPEEKDEQCTCMGVNIFSKCSFPGIRDHYNESVEKPEPERPVKPGDPPPEPGDPPTRPEEPDWHGDPEKKMDQIEEYEDQLETWKADMDAWRETTDSYQDDIEAYQDSVDKYEEDMDAWQSNFQQWKQDRSEAIGSAEAVIERVREHYGNAYKVNIISHWGWMLVIMIVVLILIFGVIKLKDRRK